ncbi:FAD-dependent oxidoreductase [Aureimonas flava]|uniref:FAD-dependent oxidoreductase n=1 Tax=Aureimonas flava TaxID=2320271 RepID=A0A3A1WKM4_9HYPH|nr:FAD-dependent oxidoreductase [Aureimonas flava]RIY00809.1 FAD-dependent oxidoreductase [Aureimonas flava]
MTKPIAVLGAGLAGLTAAAELKRRGLPAVVFEAGRSVGGMAASFKDAEGFSYDYGAHFISNRLARALGAEGICRTVRHYGEAVHLGGRSRSHPFGLMAEPRFLAGALRSRIAPRARGPAANAEDWMRRSYGDAMAEEVAMPLVEAWSGAPARDLSSSIGEKFAHGVLKSLYLSAAAKVTRRAVCNGYTRTMPEGAGVYHVYPEGGLARLLEPTLRSLDGALRLESPVERILVDRGRVVAVRSAGAEIPVSAVVSTAPVHVLPRLVEGSDALKPMAAFRYRPMIFVNLRFSGRAILPDTMVWVPDRSQLSFRLTEAPISMPWLAPEGKTLVTFDIGCEVGDERWTMGDEELAKRCLDQLCALYGEELRGRYLGAGGTIRTPISYPVYLNAYETERKRFALSTGVEGLYSVGRNGEFAHILMEDVFWRTIRRMQDVERYVAGPGAPGAVVDGSMSAFRLDGASLSQPA